MQFIDMIEKKKQKQLLTQAELHFFIQQYVQGRLPDYQVSALLMAICLNGMEDQETAWLCEEMTHSGDCMNLSSINGILCDKHSTGGVGDKTSLALLPMVAACGLKIAKMSGRGLGHTGGTLDKLESIQGFCANLSRADFLAQVATINLAIIGQSDALVPADKKLYALRDVTATVDSIPLIATSIMSKKLASGADHILLDVKVGNGAFMQSMQQAEELARSMMQIGKHFHKDIAAMITNMDQPLGNAIGNALEVKEAILTLQGKGPEDFTSLCMKAGSIMLMQGGLAANKEDALAMLQQVIENGTAFQKFMAMVEAQGGNRKQLQQPQLLPQAAFQIEIKSKQTGYVKQINAAGLGVLAMRLGAGRMKLSDKIDPAVGLVLQRKRGDYVCQGESLMKVHSNKPIEEAWLQQVLGCFQFCDTPIQKQELIHKVFM